jgi:hypothetical protein
VGYIQVKRLDFNLAKNEKERLYLIMGKTGKKWLRLDWGDPQSLKAADILYTENESISDKLLQTEIKSEEFSKILSGDIDNVQKALIKLDQLEASDISYNEDQSIYEKIEALSGELSGGLITKHNDLTDRDVVNTHPSTSISFDNNGLSGILSGGISNVDEALKELDTITAANIPYTDEQTIAEKLDSIGDDVIAGGSVQYIKFDENDLSGNILVLDGIDPIISVLDNNKKEILPTEIIYNGNTSIDLSTFAPIEGIWTVIRTTGIYSEEFLGSYPTPFSSLDLSGGILTLDGTDIIVSITDDNNKVIANPDDITYLSSTTTVDFSEFGSIDGIWIVWRVNKSNLPSGSNIAKAAVYTFDDSDLSGNILQIPNNRIIVSVVDNNNETIFPYNIKYYPGYVEVDFTNLTPISGVWKIYQLEDSGYTPMPAKASEIEFTDLDLSGGILSIGKENTVLSGIKDNGDQVFPDKINYGETWCTIDLSSFIPISGTWRLRVI